ncbi:MAG TPA: DUF6259 domain-containing protein, partial [Chthoniobacterales bacterium]
PYQGAWHAGVDVYRRWRATWHRPAPSPSWVHEVHAWQQLQIGSAEDDRRTRFTDLPSRARALARHGVTALQLVGWNDGGQDRGNPSHDPDPRLGTWEELKTAIERIEAMGIRVILFNKFVWADVTRPDYERFIASAAVDPYGMPYYHPGYEYQTPVQWMSINNRRFMVACLHDPEWQERCVREFEKSLALGASGILYDEAFHHYAATHCFSDRHGHRVPATMYSGDMRFGERLMQVIRAHGAESRFLLSAEAPFDLQQQHYALSYFRIFEGHIPAERYADPFYPILIAATGFDDREMVNRALLYRYIISYEPYHFKGDLEDFPLTLAYGKLVDALRRRYAEFLWQAQFRDILGAEVAATAGPAVSYSVFTKDDSGPTAVVLVNDDPDSEVRVTVKLAGASGNLAWVSPEEPDLHPCDGAVRVPPRGAVVVLSGSGEGTRPGKSLRRRGA